MAIYINVADSLNLDRDAISGHRDMGHKMQLVYNDVLPKNNL